MKYFTHKYRVSLFEDGKFCWKSKGWIKLTESELVANLVMDHFMIVALVAAIFLTK